jgi:hypothetical protein
MMKQRMVPKFDYNAGFLVKSPCRDCGTYGIFPDCMDRCAVLDRVQTALSASLTCSRDYSTLENYTVLYESKI